MPESYVDRYTVSMDTFPETVRVGDLFYIVFDIYNTYGLGLYAIWDCFCTGNSLFSLVTQPESSQVATWGWSEGNAAGILEVTTAGTDSSYPRLIMKSSKISQLTTGHNHSIVIDCSGDCALTGIKYGNDYISMYVNATGRINIDLGVFDGVQNLDLYFDGTENFELYIYEIMVLDTDVECPIAQPTLAFNVHYFLFDPYRVNIMKPVSNRNNARLYNENVITPGPEDNAYAMSGGVGYSSMSDGLTITPNNLLGSRESEIYHGYITYKAHSRFYYRFNAIKSGTCDMFVYFSFMGLDGSITYETPFMGKTINIFPKEVDVLDPNLSITSDRVGSKVIPRGLNKQVNQITNNAGNVDLEKLKVTVRRSASNMIFVPGTVDWTKERGGS